MRRALPAVLACLLAAPSARHGDAAEGPPLFVDSTAASAVAIPYDNGARGRLELLAIMGPGAALLDYDGDGDLDVFLPQGGVLPGDPPATTSTARGRLLRNDLRAEADGRLAARFVDVTARATVQTAGYAVAAAVGDYDGDGAPDLLLANLGADELWHNRGDGTFVESTPASLRRPGWSSGGSFFDADGDGDLDLYVVDYVEPIPAVRCYAESSRPDFCGPAAYRALPDRLLRNDGGPSSAIPSWTDVSVPSGIARAGGPGLGVVATDVDVDGRVDLHVANDGQANFLWRNRGDGTFVDEALLAGTALSRDGLARAGMGVDVGDIDGDGDEDLFVTNLTGEGNTLYVNGGDALFEDRTAEAGLSTGSLPWTGFGTAFVDADLDGWLDLLVVNGAVRLANAVEGLATPGGAQQHLERALAQPGHLYRNLGGGRFVQAPPAVAGEALSAPAVSRGLAVGDLDLDGDADAVVTSNVAPARLLLGQASESAAWIGVAPCPGVADAPWLAHRVVVQPGLPAAGLALPPLVRRPHRDGSYASARDPRVVAGLGEAPVATVELRAPSGSLSWRQPPPRRYLIWCPTEPR